MIAALPDNFVPLLVGYAVAAGSVLIAVASLWAVVRRHKAEEHFLTGLSDNMRETFMQAELKHLKEGELTERKKEDLREVIFGALQKLDDSTDRDFIEKALKQPSPRGRDNYERKIISESALRALRASEATNPAGQAGRTAEKQAQVQLSEVSKGAQQETVVPSGVRTRENVAGMNSDHPTLAAYSTAVQQMKNLPDSDPRNWRRQAAIYFNSSPHTNWFFLPWQREHLLQFEQICRDLLGDQNFALPYWNWTRNRGIPAPFWEGTLQDTTRIIGRNDEISGEIVGQSVIDRILRQSDFELFGSLRPPDQNSTDPNWQRSASARGLLEAVPHDKVHLWIGGNMATFMSPLDPIFWLHHCNLDRLWAEWNSRGHGNTSSALWRNFRLRPFGTLVGDLQNITQLGYTYDTMVQTRITDASELPSLLDRASERFELMERQVVSLGQVASFSVETPQNPLPLAAEGVSVDDVAEDGPKVVAFVHGVVPPEDKRMVVNVFLNCPYLTAETPVSDPHYVGTFAFFTVHEHEDAAEGEHDEKLMFALDLTETVDRLRALEPDLKYQLTVQLTPVPLEGQNVPPQEIAIDGVEILYVSQVQDRA